MSATVHAVWRRASHRWCAAPARGPRAATLSRGIARGLSACAIALAMALTTLLTQTASAGTAPPTAEVTPLAPADAQPETARRRVLLPQILARIFGPATGASYVTIPVLPPPTDRPAAYHADLNLALRGYTATTAALNLVTYGGDTDPDAPQMRGIFADGRLPRFTSAHRVYQWDWGCGANGCRGSAITSPPVTLLGFATRSGELLAAPSRGAEIYAAGYIALVLYADDRRLTLKYTRDDNVVGGYTVHLENLAVDPNLLARYRQTDAAGRHDLPAITNRQPLGTATGGEVLVAIRDCGTFLDPRSQKDWWH